MTELKHWLEVGAPSDVERLLRASRSEQPSMDSRNKALLAVGLGVAVTTAPSAAAGAVGGVASKGLFLLAAKWCVVGFVGAGSVVVAAQTVRYRKRIASESVPVAIASPRVGAPKRASSPAALPLGTTSAPSTEPQVFDPEPPRAISLGAATGGAVNVAARRGASRGSAEEKTSTHDIVNDRNGPDLLAEEIALIEAARSGLRQGDVARTQRAAAAYRSRFPSGRFVPEILYLQMEAMQAMGDARGAANSAREMLKLYPNCPQAPRARALLATGGEHSL